MLEKANEITRDIKQVEWKPSKGWLSKFKHRYNLAAVKEEYIATESIIDEPFEEENITIEFEEDVAIEQLADLDEEKSSDTVQVYTYPVRSEERRVGERV